MEPRPSSRRRMRRASLLTAWILTSATAAAQDSAVLHTLPEGGRGYEVMLPAPSRDLGNAPVVVYLHESDFKGFDRFKADYWAVLKKNKCVLVMPRSRNPVMWPAGEDKYLSAVITDVSKRYPVDPRKTILMGVSGGAQMALFLLDHQPKDFRAAILISSNPVVARAGKTEWFYPNRETLKACPYFVANHITQGSALMYWRQVRHKMNPLGASVSVLPVLGPVSHYLPPHKELGAWLEQVIAGKHPAPLPDPQQAAVAKMLAQAVEALPKALADAAPGAPTEAATKDGPKYTLTTTVPEGYVRAKKEDPATNSLTQIRLEHGKRPIYVRCESHVTPGPMSDVLKAQEGKTRARGMLYQVYHTAVVGAPKAEWSVKVGSMTYPDQTRGWVSPLFLYATRSTASSGRRWQAVMIMDETMEPDAAHLAAVLKTLLASQRVTTRASAPK